MKAIQFAIFCTHSKLFHFRTLITVIIFGAQCLELLRYLKFVSSLHAKRQARYICRNAHVIVYILFWSYDYRNKCKRVTVALLMRIFSVIQVRKKCSYTLIFIIHFTLEGLRQQTLSVKLITQLLCCGQIRTVQCGQSNGITLVGLGQDVAANSSNTRPGIILLECQNTLLQKCNHALTENLVSVLNRV